MKQHLQFVIFSSNDGSQNGTGVVTIDMKRVESAESFREQVSAGAPIGGVRVYMQSGKTYKLMMSFTDFQNDWMAALEVS